MNRKLSVCLTGCAIFAVLAAAPRQRASQNPSSPAFSPTIPRTWDDEAMAALEVPLADPIGSPKHVSSDYYYRIRLLLPHPGTADLQGVPGLCARPRAARVHGMAQATGSRDSVGRQGSPASAHDGGRLDQSRRDCVLLGHRLRLLVHPVRSTKQELVSVLSG
jgi:hypothetical protein